MTTIILTIMKNKYYSVIAHEHITNITILIIIIRIFMVRVVIIK